MVPDIAQLKLTKVTSWPQLSVYMHTYMYSKVKMVTSEEEGPILSTIVQASLLAGRIVWNTITTRLNASALCVPIP